MSHLISLVACRFHPVSHVTPPLRAPHTLQQNKNCALNKNQPIKILRTLNKPIMSHELPLPINLFNCSYKSHNKSNIMASHEQTPIPQAVSKIFVKAIKLLARNLNLLLPILLLSFLNSFLKSYVLPIIPIKPINPDKWILVLDHFISGLSADIIPIISFILSCVIPVITVHALSNNDAMQTSIKDLLLCRLHGGLKPPAITTVCVRVFSQAFFSFVDSPSESSNLRYPDSIIPVIPSAVLPLVNLTKRKLFDVVFTGSLMVSVVEDGCYGIKAIYKAMEALHRRKEVAAMLITYEALMVLAIVGVYNLAMFVTGSDERVAVAVVRVVHVAVIGVEEMFELAANAVFYCQCQGNVDGVEEGIGVVVDDDGDDGSM